MNLLFKITRSASSSHKYKFLEELGLSSNNLGAYFDGKWQGSGEIFKSVNPATEDVIGETRGATLGDYEKAIGAM